MTQLYRVPWTLKGLATPLFRVSYDLKGLAIVGVFLEPADAVSSEDMLTSALKGQPFNLADALSEQASAGYWHYKGSLTTPPCTEIVSYVISSAPMKVLRSTFMKYKVRVRWIVFCTFILQVIGSDLVFCSR